MPQKRRTTETERHPGGQNGAKAQVKDIPVFDRAETEPKV